MYFVNDWCIRNVCLSESELSRLVVSHPSQAFHSSIFISGKTGTLGTCALQSSERHQGTELFAEVKSNGDLLGGHTCCPVFYLSVKFTTCLMMPGLCYIKICPLKDFILLKQGDAEEDINLFRFSLGRLERGLGGWRDKQEI